MSSRETSYTVSGGTPGANSNDYVLFDSTLAFSPGTIQVKQIARFIFNLNNSHLGTLKAYWSKNKGTTWYQYYSLSVAASTAPALPGPIDFPVDGFPDWQLVWTNGGSAQTTWVPLLSSTGNRSLAQ